MDAAASASAEESASASEEDPPGSETVGRYVRVLWADDGAWYDAIVTKFSNDRHTLRYLADDTVETLDLRAERKRWCPAEDYVTPAGASIPPPAREPAGLDERGVKSGEDASGSTVLFVRKPKRLAVVAEATEAEAVADAAETKNAGDDAGERKRHACRVCLRNGVVSVDHAKFGKRCPFHPQFSGGNRVSASKTWRRRTTETRQDGNENAAKRKRASGPAGEGRAVTASRKKARRRRRRGNGTPPRPSSEADERPNPAVPPACGFEPRQSRFRAPCSAVGHASRGGARGEA